jgi:hypothetical protein
MVKRWLKFTRLCNLQGQVLVDQMVGHIFQIEDGLVKRFDIRGA